MPRAKKRRSDLRAPHLVLIGFDVLLLVLWLITGANGVLAAILLILLVLSGLFLGWIPLPGDRKRRS